MTSLHSIFVLNSGTTVYHNAVFREMQYTLLNIKFEPSSHTLNSPADRVKPDILRSLLTMHEHLYPMMMSSNGNIFRVTGLCVGKSPVTGVTGEYPHKGQWRGALMFSLICVWINGWLNNREAGDLRRRRAHYDVIVLPMYHGDVFSCTLTKVNS